MGYVSMMKVYVARLGVKTVLLVSLLLNPRPTYLLCKNIFILGKIIHKVSSIVMKTMPIVICCIFYM